MGPLDRFVEETTATGAPPPRGLPCLAQVPHIERTSAQGIEQRYMSINIFDNHHTMIFIHGASYRWSMDTIALLERLEAYPVFGVGTLASVAGLAPASARVRAVRLERRGLVHRVARDTYSVHRDPLVLASRIAWPSYVSLWYALSHHGLTLQVPQAIEVLTTRQLFRRRFEHQGVRILVSKVSPRYMFGYGKFLLEDVEVFMATPEKALLDGMLLGRIPASEVLEAMSGHIDELDVPRLVDYVVTAGNGAAAKRMGYMLHTLGRDVHHQLEGMLYPTLTLLDPALPREGLRDPRWHVLDNMGAGR
jgi:predicted transcriptional regulator of viral defense system